MMLFGNSNPQNASKVGRRLRDIEKHDDFEELLTFMGAFRRSNFEGLIR